MRTYSTGSPHAAARVVALTLLADGHLCQTELDALDQLDVPRQLGLQPGDRHLNISSPGWAKHAWSCVFAPWLAEATVVVLNHPRFDPVATLRALRSEAGRDERANLVEQIRSEDFSHLRNLQSIPRTNLHEV